MTDDTAATPAEQEAARRALDEDVRRRRAERIAEQDKMFAKNQTPIPAFFSIIEFGRSEPPYGPVKMREGIDAQEAMIQALPEGMGFSRGRLMLNGDSPDWRLARIREAHAREIADGGMVGEYCIECGWAWPCATYIWTLELDGPSCDEPWSPLDWEHPKTAQELRELLDD